MGEILNKLIENPGLLLIIIGIVGFIWAITGGGLKTKWVNLPVIANTPRKIVYGLSTVILVVGIIIFFKPSSLPSDQPTPDIPEYPIPTNPIVQPQAPQKFKLEGVLQDVFLNKLSDEPISVNIDETQIGKTITASDGSFGFDNMPENSVYTIIYFDTLKPVHVRKVKPSLVELKYVPYTGFRATICKNVDKINKEVVKPFNGNNVVIEVDSLEVEIQENLHVLNCFIEIMGSHEYSKGKNIIIYLDWYCNGNLVEDNHKLEAGMSTANNGFRTWGKKKVWKGKWKLVVRTESGYEIDHIFIELI